MRKKIPAAIILVALATPVQGSGAAKPNTRVNLSAYVGKYPYDIVGGYRFFEHPAIKAVVAKAVGDSRLRASVRYEKGDLTTPIVRVVGDRILAWVGAKGAEDVHNWAIVIAPDGSKPEVCIYEGLGHDDHTPSSRWFQPWKHEDMKLGSCPSSAEEYPPHEIAAG